MNKYKYCSLKELVTKASTGLDAIKRAPIVDHNTGIRCLRIQDFSQKKEFSNWGYCSVSLENFKRFALNPEEIIVARTGNTIGVNMYISDNLNSVFNNGLIRLRVNSSICLSKYIYYNFQSTAYWAHIESIAFGTSTQPNMQIESLLQFQVPLPSIPIQTRIASILSSLDDKIELNRQMNKTLEEMAQALFKKYFVDGDLVPLKDIIELNPKLSLKKGSVCSYIDMSNLSEIGSSVKEVVQRNFNGGSKFQNSDTLFARITPCLENGKTALVVNLEAQEVGYGSTEFIVMRAKDGISPYFVYLVARDADFRAYAIRSMVGTSGRQRVQTDMLLSYDLPKVKAEIMKEFHCSAEKIFKRIKSNSIEIKVLSQLRDTLLPKLMSGEIDLTNLNPNNVSSPTAEILPYEQILS